MKTEKQIVEENINTKIKYKDKGIPVHFPAHIVCKSHKSSCERFLEFLIQMSFEKMVVTMSSKWVDEYKRKMQDLKQAIKLYDEAGIK